MVSYTQEDKANIVAQVQQLQQNSVFADSNKKFARTIQGITDTDLSHLYNLNWQKNPKRISESKWLRLAMAVNYQKNHLLRWVTAPTKVTNYINKQLQLCQADSLTAILVDDAGIGKTHTAKEYARYHANAFYIDCSITPRKYAFVRKLGQTVGLDGNGKIEDIIEEVIYVLENLENPLLILDEAGDMDGLTMLLIKRIYNSLDGLCGIYMMGADGLRNKIERGTKWKKLGFVELFSRFGRGFKKATADLMPQKTKEYEQMAVAIATANGIKSEEQLEAIKSSLVEGVTLHDMRRVKRLVIKYKKQAA